MVDLKHAVLGALFGFGLASCGGDTGAVDVDIDSEAYSGPRIDDSNIALGVSDIAGVWDVTYNVEGLEGAIWAVNEQYLVITDTGGYIEYDYLGDDLAEREGAYANCFAKAPPGKIEKKAEGGFKVSFTDAGDTITISFNTNYGLQDGHLIAPISALITDCKCSNPIIFALPATLTQVEMDSMLCED